MDWNHQRGIQGPPHILGDHVAQDGDSAGIAIDPHV